MSKMHRLLQNRRIHLSLKFILLFIGLFFMVSCNNPVLYTLEFDTQTSINIEAIEVEAGTAIFEPEPPTREGFRFDGWMLNDEPFSFSVMPDENISLTAKWSQYFTLTFNTLEGTEIEPITLAEGDEIPFPDEPQKSHFKFGGWAKDETIFEDMNMPSSNLTLTAIWVPAITITFEASVYDRHLDKIVDISIDSIVEVAGEEISAPEIPEYVEYKFLNWQLNGLDYTFDTMPQEDITLTANWLGLSNLPVLFIDLYNENDEVIPLDNVNREFYVRSRISLENTTEAFTIETTNALFKGRGNGSWIDSGDKKGYRIKFDEKQSVLGNPESRHWVILANSNFDDITMFRNKLAFGMTNEVFTNIEYASSSEWVDVYVNGEYQGVYLIAEHLRVDEDRVDIESEYGVLDTGYLVELDYYASGINGVDYFRVDGIQYPFTVHSPSPEDYLEEGYTIDQYKTQVAYIQSMVSNMVQAALNHDLETFAQYADVDSFVDMYILHEFFKNIDSGYSSFFIYRRPGGKLIAGPPWDFDATLGCSPNRGNGSPEGIYVGLSVQAFSARTANQLLINLYATPAFKEAVIERWIEISPNLLSYINATLTDDMVETYKYAIARNFVRWPTPQGYGDPISQEDAEINWVNNIAIMKQWLIDRLEWLDGEWSNE